MKKNSEKIILIIPAYNEEDNILNTYNDIINYNKHNRTNYDCIIINDGSNDRTGQILDENKIPHIDLIHNLGIGGAVQTGYKYALKKGYDIAIQYDGDGQHDINYVRDIIEPIIKKDADFVIGSRFVENISEFKTSSTRRIGIKVISAFIKLVTGLKIYDTTSGFRAANRKIISEFAYNYPVEYPEPITTVELKKKDYNISEVAVNMKARNGGMSSIHSWKNFYYMINVCLSILITGVRRYK